MPVPEPDFLGANTSRADADSKNEEHNESNNLDPVHGVSFLFFIIEFENKCSQGKPEFHLSISQDPEIRQAKKEKPENKDPAPLRYGFSPVADNEGYRVIFICEDLGIPERSVY
jgi:hypothetical protein